MPFIRLNGQGDGETFDLLEIFTICDSYPILATLTIVYTLVLEYIEVGNGEDTDLMVECHSLRLDFWALLRVFL
jgi:hypothetical protein